MPLNPGLAFGLVQKLLGLNERDLANPRVEMILLSRNCAYTGLGLFNSIKHHQLDIERAGFTSGECYPLFDSEPPLSASLREIKLADPMIF